MGEILSIASSITTPIAFAALALLIVYLITRQLLQMQVFSNVGQRHSAGIIIRIINRLFLLALVVSVLVFAVSLAPTIVDYLNGGEIKGGTEKERKRAAGEAAEIMLAHLYERDAKALYQALPASLQQQLGYAGAEMAMKRELYQVPGAPISRSSPQIDVLSNNAIVSFNAEFDQSSVWREVLTFVSDANEWRLWSLSILPPTTPRSPADYLEAKTPAEFFGTTAASSHIGRWIGPPGWTMSIESVDEKLGDHTCNLTVTDSARQARARLSRVLGACNLEPGTRILLMAQLVSVGGDMPEFANTRYYPGT